MVVSNDPSFRKIRLSEFTVEERCVINRERFANSWFAARPAVRDGDAWAPVFQLRRHVPNVSNTWATSSLIPAMTLDAQWWFCHLRLH